MGYRIEQHITKDRLKAFCREHHIRRLALFGSAQRGDMKEDSDIDLLVEFEKDYAPGLFDLSRMELQLTTMLGRTVDLRTPEELSRYFRNEVCRNAEVQYEHS